MSNVHTPQSAQNGISNKTSYRVVIVGGGTMGEILIRGCVEICGANQVSVIEHRSERRKLLQTMYGVMAVAADDTPTKDETKNYETISHLIAKADVVLLAVKPQDFSTVAHMIAQMVAPRLQQNKQGPLIISVMAGITLDALQSALGVSRIVRCMPNTPARIGLGMTAWTQSALVTEIEQAFVRQLLQRFGMELQVDSDDAIDKATAVSGSGPAYVFLFAEQFIQAAQDLGFNPDQASVLVKQTLLGSATLLATSTDSAFDLRTQVTSKGGTTEAALQSLPQAELQSLWTTALRAAYQRAQALHAPNK